MKESETTLSYVPHELLRLHVLVRLPVKALYRFRCVSKLWCTTIGDPQFVALHMICAKEKPNLLAYFRARGVKEYSNFIYLLDDKKVCSIKFDNVYLRGFCNGLLWLGSHSMGNKILNPSTHEVLSFPEPPVGDIPLSGFGFSSLKNEYRLFMISKDFRCMVYILGTNSWRDIKLTSEISEISDSLSDYFSHFVSAVPLRRGICISSSLYWCLFQGKKILSFDMDCEEFYVIPGPPISQHLLCRSSFELQGCLSVSYNDESYPDKVEINIYTLLRSEHSRRNYWVHKRMLLLLKPSLPVFTISFSGEILFKWESAEGNLVFYNQRTKNTWKIENVLPNSHCGRCILISQVENLSSLKTLMPHDASNICRLAEFVHQSD